MDPVTSVAESMRVLLAIAGLFVMPGWFVTWALFPRLTELDHAERVALGIALSISITTAATMILNSIPGLVTAPNLALVLTPVSIVGLAIGRLRAPRAAGSSPADVPSVEAGSGRSRRSWAERGATAVAAATAVLLAGVGVYVGATSGPRPGGTQFYIVECTSAYTECVPWGRANDIAAPALVVTSAEKGQAEFRVTVGPHSEREQLIAETRLDAGSTCLVPLPAGLYARSGRSEFSLYVNSGGLPYRSLYVWTSISGEVGSE